MKNILKLSALSLAVQISFSSLADQVVQDDQVVLGSSCIGVDCVNGESFGFDTIRLKENNLRIRFVDTSSSSSFPTTDWQLTANDSANGGLNKFSIDDIDGGKTPFTIIQSAPSNSLYVKDNGFIGFNNSTPVVNLHLKYGNSPALRLEQDGSSGFTSQTWDVAGNETNFFIRDATNGSKLPFKIKPGASNNALFIAADGDVGLETASPDGQFDVAHVDNANNHAFLIGTNSAVGINIDNGQIPHGLFDVQTTGGISRFTVQADGDVGIGTSAPVGRFEVKSADNTSTYLNIDGNGNLGIGTNVFQTHLTATPKLMIKGDTNAHNAIVMDSPSPGYSSTLIFSKADAPQWYFSSRNESNSENNNFSIFNSNFEKVMMLEQDGRVGFGNIASVDVGNHVEHSNGARLTTGGAWIDASSRSFKENIVDVSLDAAKEAFSTLNPVTFTYKKQPGETYAGFIAEEVPELVALNDRKGLSSMDIIAVLTKVMQDQQKTIEKLTNRLDKIEKKQH